MPQTPHSERQCTGEDPVAFVHKSREKRPISAKDAYVHCLDKTRFRTFLRHVSDADLISERGARSCRRVRHGI